MGLSPRRIEPKTEINISCFSTKHPTLISKRLVGSESGYSWHTAKVGVKHQSVNQSESG
jgi:hypothetical protein